MVRIRLKRMGRRHRPFYRVVAADSRAPRDGRHIEVLGFYDPMTEPMTVDLKMERINHWIGNGAQPSETVSRLMKKFGSAEEAAPAEQG